MNAKQRKFSCRWVLIFACATMLLTGSLFVVSNAYAANILKMGLLQEPKTLNVWRASDRWSRKVVGLMYQALYVRDPKTLKLIPWLAAAPPEFDEKTLCYTVKIRPAKWSDGTELTSEDVAFTGRFINEFKVPRYRSKWNFVKKIETPDKHTVKFYLKEPKAIFVSRSLTTPIVQKKEWTALAAAARKTKKPLKRLLNEKIKNPVSSGPFVLKEWIPGKEQAFFWNRTKDTGPASRALYRRGHF